MMLLALETVHDRCSVCLYADGAVIAQDTEHAPRQQTQRLLPMIDALLSTQHVALDSLSAVAFNRGPGSFSGIRINTAVAQALAFMHDIPCIPVSGLQAQAQAMFLSHPELTELTIINDAKMKEVFVATYAHLNHRAVLQGAEMLLPLDASLPAEVHRLAGDGVGLMTTFASSPAVHMATEPMTAAHIAQIAWHELQSGNKVRPQDAQPVYLRHKAWKTLVEQKAARRETSS